MTESTAAAPAPDETHSAELTHVPNKDAAELLDMSIKQFQKFVKLPGCPQRESAGWPVNKLLEFAVAQQQAADDAGTEDLTGLGEPQPDAKPDAKPDEADAEPDATGPRIQYVTITVPVCDASDMGYINQQARVDARLHDRDQLLGFRSSHAGCRQSHAQFPDGRHVDLAPDWVRYVCGLIGQEIEAERFVAAPTEV